MKKLFLQIVNYGIDQDQDPETIELTKLINGLSFLGVPVCIFYTLIFAFAGIHLLTFISIIGIIIFITTIFLNKWYGFNVSRLFVSFSAPVFFGTISFLSGKDPGFYLGFLVICIPPIIIFPKLKHGVAFVCFDLSIMILSFIGNAFYDPHFDLTFAMGVYLFNLLTAFTTIITVISIFKTELSESRELLVEKNKEIIDSINYAKRIQYTLLAHDSFLKENLVEHFILFKPKDIVSGDFYWATKNDKRFYLATCDCTGHGVPGAFMSLLNISFLNEAINEKDIAEPNLIFNHVRKKLIQNVSKDGGQDGMDAILICVEGKKVTFAAANNNPVLIRNKELITLEADKMPIGKGEKTDSFTLRTIEVQQGDLLYLYTDGYADQFGGPKGKKFKYKALNNLLVGYSDTPLSAQKEILSKHFEDWRGKLEQVDDVCVIGIKF